MRHEARLLIIRVLIDKAHTKILLTNSFHSLSALNIFTQWQLERETKVATFTVVFSKIITYTMLIRWAVKRGSRCCISVTADGSRSLS